jgi:hypothetical protein
MITYWMRVLFLELILLPAICRLEWRLSEENLYLHQEICLHFHIRFWRMNSVSNKTKASSQIGPRRKRGASIYWTNSRTSRLQRHYWLEQLPWAKLCRCITGFTKRSIDTPCTLRIFQVYNRWYRFAVKTNRRGTRLAIVALNWWVDFGEKSNSGVNWIRFHRSPYC